MLRVVYAKRHYPDCHNKARYAECICAECHYAVCRCAECRGTTHRIEWQNNVLPQFHIIMFFLIKKRFLPLFLSLSQQLHSNQCDQVGRIFVIWLLLLGHFKNFHLNKQFQSIIVLVLNFGDSLGYIPKNWAICFQFSGHTDSNPQPQDDESSALPLAVS